MKSGYPSCTYWVLQKFLERKIKDIHNLNSNVCTLISLKCYINQSTNLGHKQLLFSLHILLFLLPMSFPRIGYSKVTASLQIREIIDYVIFLKKIQIILKIGLLIFVPLVRACLRVDFSPLCLSDIILTYSGCSINICGLR